MPVEKVCLKCGSYIPSGTERLRLDESNEGIDTFCPFCNCKNQTASLEELLQFDSFREFVKGFERCE